MARIFISHSSKDQEQSTRLLLWLRSQGFTSTFLDFDKHGGLAPGADWERALYREIAGADAVILILTRNWWDSKWCFAEFTQARALGKTIFPLIESPTGEIFVTPGIQHLDLTSDREGGLTQLQAALTKIALDTRGGFDWDPARAPYPGLLAFDESDAAIYFGRDDDTRRLIERMNARRAQGGEKLVVVLGASGSGKSSLLRAGLVPRLRRDPQNWIVLPPFRPQLSPLAELSQVIVSALGSGASWREWLAAFEADDLRPKLLDLARDLRALHKTPEAQILLVVDQAEELFAASDRAQSRCFFAVLSALLHPSLPFLATMSLRSDYLGHLQQEQELLVPFEQFSLKPVRLERMREIIEGPARVAGILVDEALIHAAVADAHTEDALPLLAFALRELYEKTVGTGRLSIEAYQALGDGQGQLSPLENSVRRKAEEVLSALNPAAHDLLALNEAFIPAMVRVNREGEYVRRAAALSTLPASALPLLEGLSKARLLTIQDESGVATIEVTHEALLRKWPLLRGWLDEEREFLIGKDQLEQDLLDWEQAPASQKVEALLTGIKLSRARAWLLLKPHQLTLAERGFVQASVLHHDAKAIAKQKNRRRLLQGALAATVLFAALAVISLWESREAHTQADLAASRQYAAESMEDLNENVAKALPDAVEAGTRGHTLEAEVALNKALAHPHVRFRITHGGHISIAQFSHDGTRILTASDDRAVNVWDAKTGKKLVTLNHGAAIKNTTFSADDRLIVTGGEDKSAKLWSALSGNLLQTLSGHEGSVNVAIFSPDPEGRLLLTASGGTVRVWETATGRLLASFQAVTGPRGESGKVVSASFSPSGDRCVTVGDDNLVRFWHPADGSPDQLRLDQSKVDVQIEEANFSPDGSKVLTTGNQAIVWDAKSGRKLPTLDNASYSRFATFSHDGSKIVLAGDFSGESTTAEVWYVNSGSLMTTLAGHTRSIHNVMFSRDDSRILTSSADGSARVWTTAREGESASLSPVQDPSGPMGISPDGKLMLTSDNRSQLQVWEVEDKLTGNHLVGSIANHAAPLRNKEIPPIYAVSADGNRAAERGAEDSLEIWDIHADRRIAVLPVRTSFSHQPLASFTPDGARLVFADYAGMIHVWCAASEQPLQTFSGDGTALRNLTFSPDGTLLLIVSSAETRLYNLADGQLRGHWNGGRAIFSSDSRRLAIDDTIFDTANGRKLVSVASSPEAEIFAFAPNGRCVVGADRGGLQAKLWDARTGKLVTTFSSPSRTASEAVTNAEYSIDGARLLVTGGSVVSVFDVKSGEVLSSIAAFDIDRDSVTLKGHFTASGQQVLMEDTSAPFGQLFDANTGKVLSTLPHEMRPLADGRHYLTDTGKGNLGIYSIDFDELLQNARQMLPPRVAEAPSGRAHYLVPD